MKAPLHRTKSCRRGFLVLANLLLIVATGADPLDQWTRVNPTPFATDFEALAYGAGTIVGVGLVTIATLRRVGENWEFREKIVGGGLLSGVAYGQGRFVVAGAGNRLLISSDGQDWTSITGADLTGMTQIAFGNGQFVGAGRRFNLSARKWVTFTATSEDGLTWKSSSDTFTNTVEALVYAGGSFLALGTRGLLATSADGQSWVRHATGVTNQFQAAAYGRGTWVVLGNLDSVVSTNGTAWHRLPRQWPSGAGIDFDGTRFRTVGWQEAHWVSTNGFDWQSEAAPTLLRLQPIITADDRQVTGGQGGLIMERLSDTPWRPLTSGNAWKVFQVAHGHGRSVSVGWGEANLISTNGLSWRPAQPGLAGSFGRCRYAGDHFFAFERLAYEVGQGAVSTDGERWWPLPEAGSDVAYAAGNYFVAAARGRILVSTDAMDWSEVSAGGQEDLTGIAGETGLLVAVTRSGRFLRSTDGRQWRAGDRLRFANDGPWDLQWNGRQFAAIGMDPARGGTCIAVSNDGLTWRWAEIPLYSINFRSLAGAGGWWVAGGDGELLVSHDGEHWERRPLHIPTGGHGVSFGDNRFWVGGAAGTIARTEPIFPDVSSLTASVSSGTSIRLRTESVPGRRLQVERSADHRLSGSWAPVTEFLPMMPQTELVLPLENNETSAFYRLRARD